MIVRNDARESAELKEKLSNADQNIYELSNRLVLTQKERDHAKACDEEKEKMISELSATIDVLTSNLERSKTATDQQLR